MPTPRRRSRKTRENPVQERLRQERKSLYLRAINEAAERVFAEKGSGGSHMREIAAEAGISLGTLYGVVEGKESLLAGIHRERMREFLDCIREARDSEESTLASHLAVVRHGARYFLERPDFLRMCVRAGFGWASSIPAAGPGADLWREGSSIPRELFARGIDEGIYVADDPDLLVRKMLALKQAELTYWADHGMETPHDVVLERLADQFVRAFCVRAT